MKRTIFLVLICLVCPRQALATDTLETSLLADIKKAEATLRQTEEQIARERSQLVSSVNTLEREVMALRDKTAVARRLTDENTLGLKRLEDRLQEWRGQHVYQQNLLAQFLRQQKGNMPVIASAGQRASLEEQILAVSTIADALPGRVQPRWQAADIVMPSGAIEPADTFRLGPVTWYRQGENAGLVDTSGDIFKASLALEGADRTGILALAASQSGILAFDPSMSRAIAEAQQQESPLEHVRKGGLWVIPILIFALFALTIALIKAVQLWRLPAIVTLGAAHLKSLASRGLGADAALMGPMQKRLATIAASQTSDKVRDDQLFATLLADKHWLERWLGAIAITASVSPLLGLLGTVSGMIETFKMMTLFGSGDPEVVSGGIAQALVTTELGLIVAIPALILNALLSRRAKSYYAGLEAFAIQLSQIETDSTQAPRQSSQREPGMEAVA